MYGKHEDEEHGHDHEEPHRTAWQQQRDDHRRGNAEDKQGEQDRMPRYGSLSGWWVESRRAWPNGTSNSDTRP